MDDAECIEVISKHEWDEYHTCKKCGLNRFRLFGTDNWSYWIGPVYTHPPYNIEAKVFDEREPSCQEVLMRRILR
jgi:hypothetical protein